MTRAFGNVYLVVFCVYVCVNRSGGVKVSTNGGRIVSDNTLDSRLEAAMHDLQPVVRHVLFPSCRAEVREKPKVEVHGFEESEGPFF